MAWTERYVTSSAAGGGDGLTEGTAWTLAEGITNEVAGMRINIKAGTYANTTTARSFAAVGLVANWIWWRGYKTTIGDLDVYPISLLTLGTDIPNITFTSANAETGVASAYHKFSNIGWLTATATMAPMRVRGTTTDHFHRCRFEHTGSGSANANAIWVDGAVILSECWFRNANPSMLCVNFQNTSHHIVGCIVNGVGGVAWGSNNVTIIGNIIANTAGNALDAGAGEVYIVGNTIINPSGHGISMSATPSTRRGYIMNNLFHTVNKANKVGIYNPSSGQAIQLISNAFYNVTMQQSGTINTIDTNTITETIDPLVNYSGGDFRLRSSSQSFLKASPYLFEGTNINAKRSIGATEPTLVGSDFNAPIFILRRP